MVSPRGQFEWKARLPGRCCSHTHCLARLLSMACALSPSTFKSILPGCTRSSLSCVVTACWLRLHSLLFYSPHVITRVSWTLWASFNSCVYSKVAAPFRCPEPHQLKDVEVFFFLFIVCSENRSGRPKAAAGQRPDTKVCQQRRHLNKGHLKNP